MSQEKEIKKLLNKMEKEDRRVSKMSIERQQDYQRKQDEKVLREMKKRKWFWLWTIVIYFNECEMHINSMGGIIYEIFC